MSQGDVWIFSPTSSHTLKLCHTRYTEAQGF